MSTATITTIKNGTITLPKKILQEWRGYDIYVYTAKDTVILKKVFKPSVIFDSSTVKKLKAIGRTITQKDIDTAVQTVRSQKSAV